MLLGDMVDFESIARFARMKSRSKYNFQNELDRWRKLATWFFEPFPRAKKEALEGNHERRVPKWCYNQVDVDLDCLNVKNLLSCDQLGIKYYPNGYRFLDGGRFMVKHGRVARKGSANSGREEMNRAGTSGMSAHCHRVGMTSITRGKRTTFWYEIGHLGDPLQSYLDWYTDWQQGFAVGEFPARGQAGPWRVSLVPIVDGRAVRPLSW